MQRVFLVLLAVLVACSLQLTVGCGGKATKKTAAGTPTDKDEGPSEEARTALASKGWATLKGKVTLDGERPEPKTLKAIEDKTECHGGTMEEKIEQTWIVNENKEVANVAIWVRPPKGKYFNIKAEDKDRSGQKVHLKQPHCAFIPHVLALYPSYYDGKELKKTGQELVVENNAKFSHNTKIEGLPLENPMWDSQTLPPGKEKVVPERKPQDQPLNVVCNIHSWMNAKIWVFDNPYHAVTGPDGSYEIKNVPAGAKVYVVAWHEQAAPSEWVLPESGGSQDGQEIEFEDGKTKVLNFKVKHK